MLVEGIDDEVLFTVGCLCLLVIAVLVKIGIGQSGETVRPARRPTPAPQPSSTDDRAPVQPGRYGNVPSQESGDRSSTQGRDESVRPTVVPPSGEQERANAYGPASASDIDVVIKTVVPESQTVVACPPRQTILFLKRRAFPDLMAEGRRVRLIFRGRVLDDDATLTSLGIENNTVIHAQVSARDAPPPPVNAQEVDADIAHLFRPLLGVIVVISWFTMINYPALISGTARVFIIGLTTYFALNVFSRFVRQHGGGPPA